jgi:hypothetical protein
MTYAAPRSQYTFTKGGHFSVVTTSEKRVVPSATAELTDAERIALYKTLAANAGTYRVEGNKIFFTYTTAWNEIWAGTTRMNTFEVKGITLIIVSPPFVTINTGKEIVFTTTLERIE